MKTRAAARLAGSVSLWLLAVIHLVLPFTLANTHSEVHIKIGAVLIWSVFLGLAMLSRRAPRATAGAGLLFFLVVSSTAAATQRFPVEEGLAIKLFFVLTLLFCLVRAQVHVRSSSEHTVQLRT
jgi:hypothetical protein